jgi:hypothetical protein
VGGGAILTLFPAQSETFGFYGIGLGIGFFAYLAMLLVLVAISPEATVNWILGFGGHPTDEATAPVDHPAFAPPDEVDRPMRLVGKFRIPLPPL